MRLETTLTATAIQVCAGYLEDDQEEVLLLALGRLHLLLQPLDLLLQLAFLVLAGLVHVLVVATVPLWRQTASPEANKCVVFVLFFFQRDLGVEGSFPVFFAYCNHDNGSRRNHRSCGDKTVQLLPVKPPSTEYICSTFQYLTADCLCGYCFFKQVNLHLVDYHTFTFGTVSRHAHWEFSMVLYFYLFYLSYFMLLLFVLYTYVLLS